MAVFAFLDQGPDGAASPKSRYLSYINICQAFFTVRHSIRPFVTFLPPAGWFWLTKISFPVLWHIGKVVLGSPLKLFPKMDLRFNKIHPGFPRFTPVERFRIFRRQASCFSEFSGKAFYARRERCADPLAALATSGWTKVAAFASGMSATPQIICDSRVATSLVSRLDVICVAAGIQTFPVSLSGLGAMPALSSTPIRNQYCFSIIKISNSQKGRAPYQPLRRVVLSRTT